MARLKLNPNKRTVSGAVGAVRVNPGIANPLFAADAAFGRATGNVGTAAGNISDDITKFQEKKKREAIKSADRRTRTANREARAVAKETRAIERKNAITQRFLEKQQAAVDNSARHTHRNKVNKAIANFKLENQNENDLDKIDINFEKLEDNIFAEIEDDKNITTGALDLIKLETESIFGAAEIVKNDLKNKKIRQRLELEFETNYNDRLKAGDQIGAEIIREDAATDGVISKVDHDRFKAEEKGKLLYFDTLDRVDAFSGDAANIVAETNGLTDTQIETLINHGKLKFDTERINFVQDITIRAQAAIDSGDFDPEAWEDELALAVQKKYFTPIQAANFMATLTDAETSKKTTITELKMWDIEARFDLREIDDKQALTEFDKISGEQLSTKGLRSQWRTLLNKFQKPGEERLAAKGQAGVDKQKELKDATDRYLKDLDGRGMFGGFKIVGGKIQTNAELQAERQAEINALSAGFFDKRRSPETIAKLERNLRARWRSEDDELAEIKLAIITNAMRAIAIDPNMSIPDMKKMVNGMMEIPIEHLIFAKTDREIRKQFE